MVSGPLAPTEAAALASRTVLPDLRPVIAPPAADLHTIVWSELLGWRPAAPLTRAEILQMESGTPTTGAYAAEPFVSHPLKLP